MSKKRKNFTPEEKVLIIRKHLLDKVPVSDLCDTYNLQPNTYYLWQKAFFENGASAFQKDSTRKNQAAERKISALEAKLRRKNEVLSELMEEHVALKKSLGEL